MRRVSTIDVAVTLLAVAWTVLYVALSVLQYETGHNASFDLALYARSLWGIAHGVPFNPLRDQHALALHSHLILYLLAPLTKLVSPVYLLLTLQAISLGGAGLVLYTISKRRLGSQPLAACVALSYFFYPVAANTSLFDMHPKTLAMMPILWVLDGLDRNPDTVRSLSKAAAWMLLCFACREDIAICFAVVGVYWLLMLRRVRAGLLLVILSTAFFFFYELVVRPALGADFASMQAHFGALKLAAVLDQADVVYILLLLGGFAFLPLLGLRFAIGAAVPIAINILSDFAQTNSIQSHYAFLALPFLAMGAVYGLSRLDAAPKLQPVATAGMLVAAIAVGVFGSVGPGGRSFDSERFTHSESSRAVQTCIDAIPREAGVYAPVQWAAHLADRPVIRHTFGSVEQIATLDSVLLERAPIPYFARADGYAQYMAQRRRQIALLQQTQRFAIAERCEPYVLLKRGGLKRWMQRR